jgi:hypothetical protein
MLTPSLRLTTLGVGAVLAAACATNATSGPVRHELVPSRSAQSPSGPDALTDVLGKPALIALDSGTGALVFWPIRPKGGNHPRTLSKPLGLSGASSMVANGNVVAIANRYPPEVVLYDVKTKAQSTLSDPYGTPLDIAIDRNAALYVLNFANPTGNVAMYPAGSPQPKKLGCRFMKVGDSIAVDNEGDIFINGIERNGFYGVVEIPNGPGGPEPRNCTRLRLKQEPGYDAGLAVDPKTDDLIVLDNPDQCAGGSEGRMTIYPKPYQRSTGRSHQLGANCAGGIRLDATSTVVFVGDQSVSGAYTYILQRSYPDGKNLGTYNGVNPAGMTTIPNTLPN